MRDGMLQVVSSATGLCFYCLARCGDGREPSSLQKVRIDRLATGGHCAVHVIRLCAIHTGVP